ncbi:MAG: tyrosine-type recombinase/integrase [Phycisphaeraceae bacterium]|nr:MAG: tyrosine-type recombinase/integrase [Phycisphaeraceae bacterium]
MRGRQKGRGRTDGAKRERASDVPDRRAARAAWAAGERVERKIAKQRGARIACVAREERPGETLAASAATAARTPRRPKPKRRLPPEVLTDDEVRALLDACGRYTPVALRNRALITLMYRAGLRVSEALALQPKDVDLENGVIRVLHGKGDRYRAVGLDPGAAAVVAAWLAERGRGQRVAAPANGETDPVAAAPLLCTAYGTPVTTGYVRRLMKRLGRQAGIAKRVHAHGLRHTHAAQLREEGVDVGIISRQLGHRSLLTTIRYLDHVQPTAVVDAMRGRVWETT